MQEEIHIEPEDESLVRVTMAVYALQAIGFFTIITFIAGVVVNYIKKEDVEGSWLASHCRWQLRTFWFALLWTVVGYLTFMLVVGVFILGANVIWVIYRIAKGWLRLVDGKPMYV